MNWSNRSSELVCVEGCTMWVERTSGEAGCSGEGHAEPTGGSNEDRGNGDRHMVTTWVVVLEAADAEGGEIDVDVVERLLEAVAEADPVALYNADRYALQLSVASESAPEALLTAIALWRSAARRTEAPLWELARAEVITQAEFERERSLLDDGVSVLQTGDEALEALLEEAFHDALTGLASPCVFHDRIDCVVNGAATT